MYVKIEIQNFYWLLDHCWSGALDRLKEIKEHDLEDDFMNYLEMCMFNDFAYIPTLTELNDFIWFDCDEWIEENIQTDEE